MSADRVRGAASDVVRAERPIRQRFQGAERSNIGRRDIGDMDEVTQLAAVFENRWCAGVFDG